MNRLTLRALVLVSLLTSLMPHAWAETARVIVQFKTAAQVQTSSASDAATRPQRASWLGGRHGLSLRDGRVIDARRQVVMSDATDATTLAAQLRLDPAVDWAEPDHLRRLSAYPATAPNDPLYAAGTVKGQWYLRAPTSTEVSAINAQAAWATSTGAGVVVADIDTGVLFNHPDLSSKLHPGYDFVSSTSYNRDGDGVDADAADPGDWRTNSECSGSTSAASSSWHGTQTSSIIGASTNNGVGMAGVAPGAMVLPLRVLADCGGYDSDIIAAMLWAAGLPNSLTSATNAHPARVLNLSLGSAPAQSGVCPASYQSVMTQLTNAGVVVVAAAGNDEGLAVEVPGNCPGVIAVGGLRHTGTKVGYANVGPEVALSAPAGNCVNTSGACIYTIITATNSSTQAPSAGGYTYTNTSNYALGTSFSTPMVAGAAALMLSVNSALSPSQVKSLLQSSARAFPSSLQGVAACHEPNGVTQDECLCTTTTCGAGMLDVTAAVAAASPSATPTVSVTSTATAYTTGSSIALDGSASAASTGRSLAGYTWAVTSGGGIASLSGATNLATATLDTTGTGFVAVTLTVVDNAGAQAARTRWLAVNAAATPVASVQLPSTSVMAGESLLADGSASTGTAYAWQLLDGSSRASISSATNASTAQLQTVANQTGDVALGLTVDDGQGHQGSDVATLSVVAVHPTAAIAANAYAVAAGQAVILDAGASTATSGRTVAGYSWAIVAGSNIASFSSGTNAATATLSTTAAGTVRVQVTVTDSQGATDTRTSDITVTVAAVTATTALGSQSGGGGGAMRWSELLAACLLLIWLGIRRGPAVARRLR